MAEEREQETITSSDVAEVKAEDLVGKEPEAQPETPADPPQSEK